MAMTVIIICSFIFYNFTMICNFQAPLSYFSLGLVNATCESFIDIFISRYFFCRIPLKQLQKSSYNKYLLSSVT